MKKNVKKRIKATAIIGTASLYIAGCFWAAKSRKKGKHTFVQNNSPNIIWFKPDNTVNGYIENKAYPLNPSESINIPVDGISTKYKKGMVFKIPDGGIVTVNSDNSINLNYCSVGWIVKLIRKAGWMEMNQDNWQELMNKSK